MAHLRVTSLSCFSFFFSIFVSSLKNVCSIFFVVFILSKKSFIASICTRVSLWMFPP